MNQKILNTENRIAEYNNLRNEIIHYDKLCFNILAFVFTVTGFCYTYYFKDINLNLSIVIFISFIWYIGYRYLSEKRWLIRKIAFYLRNYVESNTNGLFWENWIFHNKSVLNKEFPRFSPSILEGVLAIFFTTTNLTIWIASWCNITVISDSIYIKISGLLILLLLLIFTAKLFWDNIKKRKKYQAKTN